VTKLRTNSNPEYCIELGQSHDGSLGYVLAMIDALAKRGINLVKFQMHLPVFESTKLESFRVPLTGQDNSRYEYWDRTGFKAREWEIIKLKCDENNVEFLCTPLSVQAVEALEQLKVKRFKIASGDLTNTQLLEAVSSTQKPVILSTGMAYWDEITAALDILDPKLTTLLQCTSKYPSGINEAGFNVMEEMRERFPSCKIGFSDHSGNPYLAMWAFALGADFVEQHVVFSKEQYGPDTSSSVDLEDVSRIADFLSVGLSARNKIISKDQVAESLTEIRKLFGRGISPLKEIKKGQEIHESDLTFKKPVGDLHWRDRDKLIGMVALRDLNPDDHISITDVVEKSLKGK
jgi:N-acetylneuraminate synthase